MPRSDIPGRALAGETPGALCRCRHAGDAESVLPLCSQSSADQGRQKCGKDFDPIHGSEMMGTAEQWYASAMPESVYPVQVQQHRSFELFSASTSIIFVFSFASLQLDTDRSFCTFVTLHVLHSTQFVGEEKALTICSRKFQQLQSRCL
jgi:hypothetical protein